MIQALEADPDVDVILGIGSSSPSVPFERAEFVRGDQTYSILSRIVKATQVDTILHTFLVVDSTLVPARALHEIDVIGTMNLLAAAGAPVHRSAHRLQVVHVGLWRHGEGPEHVLRGHTALVPAEHPSGAGAGRGRGARA